MRNWLPFLPLEQQNAYLERLGKAKAARLEPVHCSTHLVFRRYWPHRSRVSQLDEIDKKTAALTKDEIRFIDSLLQSDFGKLVNPLDFLHRSLNQRGYLEASAAYDLRFTFPYGIKIVESTLRGALGDSIAYLDESSAIETKVWIEGCELGGEAAYDRILSTQASNLGAVPLGVALQALETQTAYTIRRFHYPSTLKPQLWVCIWGALHDQGLVVCRESSRFWSAFESLFVNPSPKERPRSTSTLRSMNSKGKSLDHIVEVVDRLKVVIRARLVGVSRKDFPKLPSSLTDALFLSTFNAEQYEAQGHSLVNGPPLSLIADSRAQDYSKWRILYVNRLILSENMAPELESLLLQFIQTDHPHMTRRIRAVIRITNFVSRLSSGRRAKWWSEDISRPGDGVSARVLGTLLATMRPPLSWAPFLRGEESRLRVMSLIIDDWWFMVDEISWLTRWLNLRRYPILSTGRPIAQ